MSEAFAAQPMAPIVRHIVPAERHCHWVAPDRRLVDRCAVASDPLSLPYRRVPSQMTDKLVNVWLSLPPKITR